MNKPIRLAVLNADTLVFADINNHAVRTITLDGTVATLAGGLDREGHLDGPASEARLRSPHGVAVRADGVIAVAEASGHTIRLLTPVDGGSGDYDVSTLAGVPGVSGMLDGAAAEALFSAPHAVAWGARGELYVADIGNARLRQIEDGVVITLAGGEEHGSLDGPLGVGTLKFPMDLAIDEGGAVWIADAGTILIRRWRPEQGLDTPFASLQLTMPHGLTVLPDAVLVADLHAQVLYRVDRATGVRTTLLGTGDKGIGYGKMNQPAAVVAHAGLLWIADLDNHRIVTCLAGGLGR